MENIKIVLGKKEFHHYTVQNFLKTEQKGTSIQTGTLSYDWSLYIRL